MQVKGKSGLSRTSISVILNDVSVTFSFFRLQFRLICR